MPLAVPPVASIPLYARNKDTGETFLIGPPASMIDDLGDVDTSTTGPTGGSALVWDADLGQWVPGAPASALAFWDPVVNYVTDDKVLWPEVSPISLWKARRDNINEEPVELAASSQPGFDFTTGNVNAGNFPSGLDFSAGMETVILLSGPVAASGEFFMFGPQMGGTTCRLAIVGADLAFGVAFNGPVTNYTTPLAGWDSVTNPYLKVACDTVNVVFSQSADGSTFTDFATVATPGADLSDSWQVGIGNMYLGALASVETKNGAGVLQQSWVAATQDPTNGAGVSPKTGETYSGAAVPSVPGDPAWALIVTLEAVSEVEVDAVEPTGEWELWADTSTVGPIVSATAISLDQLTDVDTATTAPTDGQALVFNATSGLWQPSVNVLTNEVHTSATDPRLDPLTATVELWVDTRTDPPILRAWSEQINPAGWVALEPAATTNINAVLENGWAASGDYTNMTGGATAPQFRVTATSVTFAMLIWREAAVTGNASVKICGYPSGVPAPWQRLIFAAWQFGSGLSGTQWVAVECRGDGIYCLGGDPGYAGGPQANVADRQLQGTVTWAR